MTNYTKVNLDDIQLNLISKEDAADIITSHDSYINNLTQYDLDARCHKNGATLDEYLQLCKNAVRDFSEEESSDIAWDWAEIGRELQRHGMQIPKIEEINLVRTSGAEENGAAGYTRGNTIFLCDGAFSNGEGFLEEILTHELFHVLTRNCLEFKRLIYSVIGYHVEDKLFDFPQTGLGQFISNPDVANQVCWTRMEVGFHKYNTLCVLFTNREYHGERFFSLLYPHFLVLGDNKEFVRDEDGELKMLSLHECTDSYLEHVGRNTSYISNPEEVLAVNFTFAVLGTLDDLPNPEIVDSIRQAMH